MTFSMTARMPKIFVLGSCGGGGRELCFLEADEEGGGVFSFIGADEDGVGQGGIEGDLCLLGGDVKG